MAARTRLGHPDGTRHGLRRIYHGRLRRGGVAVCRVELAWPVPDWRHSVSLDQLCLDSVVVVAVELVLVSPRVGEIEGPAHVEIDEITDLEALPARIVDSTGQRPSKGQEAVGVD